MRTKKSMSSTSLPTIITPTWHTNKPMNRHPDIQDCMRYPVIPVPIGQMGKKPDGKVSSKT